MPVATADSTPDPAVNALLDRLLRNSRAILGPHFAGMYLEGSLVTGAFDQDSDIDFVVACDTVVGRDHFAALRAMHDDLATLDSPWAIQLEGSYLSLQALRRHRPDQPAQPNIERGPGERLKLVRHDATWDIHRHILRTHGIALAGPAPAALIDAISPDALRRAAQAVLEGWAARLLADPGSIAARGYQSYIVLSLCRILYTLEQGAVASKPVAARWAQERLGPPWTALIERAWFGRHHPDATAGPDDVSGTLALIRYVVAQSQTFGSF